MMDGIILKMRDRISEARVEQMVDHAIAKVRSLKGNAAETLGDALVTASHIPNPSYREPTDAEIEAAMEKIIESGGNPMETLSEAFPQRSQPTPRGLERDRRLLHILASVAKTGNVPTIS